MLKAKILSNTNAERLQLSDPVIEIVSSDYGGVNSEATSAFKVDTDPHYLSAVFLLPVSYFPTPHAIQTTLICTNGKKNPKNYKQVVGQEAKCAGDFLTEKRFHTQ